MCNAKDCEQYHPDNICCTCQNLEWYKLKQTLTEIKKIAENLAPMTDEYDNCYYKDSCSKCKFQEDCQYFKVEQILQKISEAENETTTR